MNGRVWEDRRPLAIVIFILVVLLLAVPFGLVVGARSSSANFAESKDIGVNHLGAATLDIEVGAERTRLGAEGMAPGDTAIGTIELGNLGSLPLRYSVTAESSGGLLASWLLWDVWTEPIRCSETHSSAGHAVVQDLVLSGPMSALVGSAATGSDPGDRVLRQGERELLCIAARLPLAAPNEVQRASITVDLVIDAEHDVVVTQ